MREQDQKVFILGAGVTGLAAGMVSGFPVLEGAENPGGICSSYLLRPRSRERLFEAPEDGEAYRFEIGGGHWIFGGEPTVLNFIRSLVPVKSYARKSSVYFHHEDLFVPYPLQNHLRFLRPEIKARALKEMSQTPGQASIMEAWLKINFGSTLCDLFFNPFHELYTAGLHRSIAPQDAYKSPVNLELVKQGAEEEAQSAGYNVTFIYPEEGLNVLAKRMAERADVRYGRRIERIDAQNKKLFLADGTAVDYDSLLSTFPLNKMMEMTELEVSAPPDPYTSVLVLNIGAVKGARAPEDHWLYNCRTRSGFHRVGFYSNVDPLFLPASSRQTGDRVSLYIERAFQGGTRPSEEEVRDYCFSVVEELKSWGFISEAEVVDPTWIDVAYTWSWPDSPWKPLAIKALEKKGIYQIGRYGRWQFQGIADSIRDGFYAGTALKQSGAMQEALKI